MMGRRKQDGNHFLPNNKLVQEQEENEEGEEVQAKGICNIFNKIITENFPNLGKTMLIQYRKPPGHQTDWNKIELPHYSKQRV
jgi:hypothetical protein